MKLLLLIPALFLAKALLSQHPGINKAWNDSVYVADARIQIHDLKKYTAVYTDSSNMISIEEMSSEKFSNRFRPLSTMVQPAQPYITYWLKISISALGAIDNWWLLLYDDPADKNYHAENSYVDAWFLNNVHVVTEHQRTGILVPRSQKAIKENLRLNRILFSAKAGETKYVYLRVYNEFGPDIISSPQLRDPIAGVPGKEPELWIIFGSGGAFFFAIISFFFYFFVKEKAYLYFGLYALTLSQHYLIVHSYLPFVSWYIPEHPHLVMPAFFFLTISGFIFFALFGRSFINLPQLSKRLDTIFKWVIAFWIATLITTVVLITATHRVRFTEVNFIFVLLFLIFLIRIAFFKSILIRVFVAGALWLLCFSILGFLWERVPLSLPFNPWPTGQLGQLLIYAAGLAYKVRLNEKARAHAEIVKIRNVELAGLYEQSKKQKEEIEVQKKNAEEALVELKAAQTQLIQSEKMASLGELTAGIAHEIQNPLNFVNNFSEVNKELVDELQQELRAGKLDDAIVISNDIKENEEKINHHGKRADAIVKGMLQHSRRRNSIKEPTDINKLADEIFRLAYHGLRAKDKSFNVTMKTDYDENIGNINIIPQDIGRVLLNLCNNAFYAVCPPTSQGGIKNPEKGYEPTVWVKTSLNLLQPGGGGAGICISVRDNGPGIPPAIVDKIFQPFFTTKPAGQGTGLGLSLSYDIVKAHGGELRVETSNAEGTEFVVQLPDI